VDTRVHARFYRVSKPEAGVTDFAEVLLGEASKGKPGDRERDIGGGIVARLEHCSEDGDAIEGEFCRVQSQNIPPQTGPDGLLPIKLEAGGIGHVAAFRFHKPTRVLLLQRNVSSLTAARLGLFLASTKADRLFAFNPVLAKDAMQRFMDRKPRGFSVTFAGPENLESLDDAGIPAAHGARLIAEAYDGVRVKIEVSVGRSRKKWLGKDSIFAALGALVDADGVKGLKVKADKNGEDDVINFLKEQLHGEDTLDLPEGDPEGNYTRRKLLLRKLFSDNMGTIMAQFG
jgi:hypothetical protein